MLRAESSLFIKNRYWNSERYISGEIDPRESGTRDIGNEGPIAAMFYDWEYVRGSTNGSGERR